MAAKKKGMSKDTKVALEVGAGVLAAAAAAGAGYYFYGDKDAKKHRAAASAWAKGMKADVLKEARKAKKLDQKAMAAIVDKATAAYQAARGVDKADLAAAARELKKHWRKVEEELNKAKSSVKKATKKTGTAAKKSAKTAKKTAKKSAKKGAKKGAKASTKRAR